MRINPTDALFRLARSKILPPVKRAVRHCLYRQVYGPKRRRPLVVVRLCGIRPGMVCWSSLCWCTPTSSTSGDTWDHCIRSRKGHSGRPFLSSCFRFCSQGCRAASNSPGLILHLAPRFLLTCMPGTLSTNNEAEMV